MTVNPHYIPRLFTLSRCHKRRSLDRDSDRMQMTHFSFNDHDATQSERAHCLGWTVKELPCFFCIT